MQLKQTASQTRLPFKPSLVLKHFCVKFQFNFLKSVNVIKIWVKLTGGDIWLKLSALEWLRPDWKKTDQDLVALFIVHFQMSTFYGWSFTRYEMQRQSLQENW